jgi:hypothetical protein
VSAEADARMGEVRPQIRQYLPAPNYRPSLASLATAFFDSIGHLLPS